MHFRAVRCNKPSSRISKDTRLCWIREFRERASRADKSRATAIRNRRACVGYCGGPHFAKRTHSEGPAVRAFIGCCIAIGGVTRAITGLFVALTMNWSRRAPVDARFARRGQRCVTRRGHGASRRLANTVKRDLPSVERANRMNWSRCC